MIGPEVGIRCGLRAGVGDGIGPLPLRDGPLNLPMPRSQAEVLALGLPSAASIYLCQDVAGNLTDALGNLNLVAAGTPLYGQTFDAGYAGKAVGLDDASVDAFTVAGGVGDNPTTTSSAVYFVADFLANPAAVRQFLSLGGAAGASEQVLRIGNTGLGVLKSGGTSASSANNFVSGGVIRGLLMHNRAAGPRLALFTHLEIVNVAYAAATDGVKGFGNSLVTSPSCTLRYALRWSGANAEMTDAQARDRMQKLGNAVPW